MKAIELQTFNSPLVAVERPIPTIAAGEELIDVTACGVCHSDIHVVDGLFGSPLPLIILHEYASGFHASKYPSRFASARVRGEPS